MLDPIGGRIRTHRHGLDQGGPRDPARPAVLPCSRPWRTSTTTPPGWLRPTATLELSAVLDGYGATVRRMLVVARAHGGPPRGEGVLLTVRPADRWWPSFGLIHELMLQPLPDPAVDGQVLADMAHSGACSLHPVVPPRRTPTSPPEQLDT